jgi:O-antigen ligase
MALRTPPERPVDHPPSEQLKRWFVILLLSVLFGALCGSVTAPIVDSLTAPRGVVYGVPLAVAPADHALGANVDLLQLDAAGRGLFYAQAERIGLRWIRLSIPWRDGPSVPIDWSRIDAVVDEANTHHVRVLAVLQEIPDWTRDPRQQPGGSPPSDWRVFGSFVFQVASHFSGRIGAYQVWDEPNISSGWLDQYPDAVGYTHLLREASIQIRRADQHALVVSAALAPTSESGPLNVNEPEFLRQMYRAGARDFFDALGAEPFGFWSGPDDRRLELSTLNFSRVVLMREVMQANGDGGKAIWATAFGWNTGGADGSPFGSDTPDMQSARTLEAIQRARDEWPWLGPLMFARWGPEGAGDARAGFALVQPDGSPGPLLDALVARAASKGIATVGRYPPDDSSAVYPLTWRVAPDGADLPQSDSAPVMIRFRGTRFDLDVRRGLYDGILFVQVDGGTANALPRDEHGRSYVVLFDPLGQSAEVTLARGLPDGAHLVELVPQGGWGQWALAGWSVAREPDPNLVWPFAIAACGTLLFLLGAASFRQIEAVARGWRPQLPNANRLSVAAAPYAQWIVFGVGALLYLSPNAAASWVLIVVLTLLVLWRLEEGLALVALSIPFYLQPKALGVGSFAVVEIVVLQCVLSLGVRRVWQWYQTATGKQSDPLVPARAWLRALPHLGALDRVVLLWLLAGALGVIVAENVGVANREFRVVFLEPALYYLLIRLSKADFRPLVYAFLAGATLISLKAVGDWIRHTDVITSEGVVQARSVYFSPNNLALYLDRAVPLALAMCLFGRSRRWVYGLVFGVTLVALYLTFVKGAWLLAIPAAFLLMGALRGRRFFAGALLLLAALGASLLPVLGTTRIRSLFDFTSGTSFTRVQLWQSAIAMIREHPLLGVGLDNFLYQYRTRYILPTAFAEAGLSHPHNILLDFWTRLGLLGLVLLAMLLLVFWRRGLLLYRRLADDNSRALVLGLMASMLAALAHGLIDNSFFLVDLAFVLMLTLAIFQRLNNDS